MRNLFTDRLEFDDIVFENRNKDYGAYPLRKKYNRNIIISVLAASLIVISSVLIPYVNYIGKAHRGNHVFRVRYVEARMEKIEPPREDIYVPPAPPPPEAITNIRYVAPTVVDSILPVDKPQPSVADVQASNPENEQKLIAGAGNSDDLITGQDGEKSDDPYVIVEVSPTFKGGGLEKFREWVQRKTVYPEVAQENGIKGRVMVSFIVERDGSVSNVNVVKSVNPILDAEAVKSIESSPKWSPGLQRGKPVRVRFIIPLIFSFNR